MNLSGVDFERMYPDYGEDYDSFEKCVVRVIDSTEALAGFLDDFLSDINLGAMEGSPDLVKCLRTQKAVCLSLRNSLSEWGLGIPENEHRQT